MNVNVSLPDSDVAFLDAYAARNGLASRSDVLQIAVTLLQTTELEAAYKDAWATWSESEDGQLWELTAGDGLG
jgi:Arc/MetJ-type ribon-helix-helix transcriptional regulator